MVYIVSLFLVLFSSISFAGNGSGNVSSVVQLGGSAIGTYSAGINQPGGMFVPESLVGGTGGYFMLSAVNGPTFTSENATPLLKDGVAYQVTAGKTAVCIQEIAYSVASGIQYQLISATAPFSANVAFGTLTGPVYQGGLHNAYIDITPATTGGLASQQIIYKFAASTYPGVIIGAGQTSQTWIKLICKEM